MMTKKLNNLKHWNGFFNSKFFFCFCEKLGILGGFETRLHIGNVESTFSILNDWKRIVGGCRKCRSKIMAI